MRGRAALVVLLLSATTAACVYDTRGLNGADIADDGGDSADAAPDDPDGDPLGPDAGRADAAPPPDAPLPDAHACPGSYHFVPVAGSAYRVRNNQRTWFDAEADCESDGDGIHLVVIDDAIEMQVVDSAVDAFEVWVGLSDRDVEGTWERITGGEAPFQPWAPGEPNNQNGNEDCAELVGNTLNDARCDTPHPYVCECD